MLEFQRLSSASSSSLSVIGPVTNAADLEEHAGGKTIGFWGGVMLLLNNLCGPALVLIPGLFQECGVIAVSSLLVVCAVLSGIDSYLLIESMRRMKGNQDLSLHAEYTSVISHWFSSSMPSRISSSSIASSFDGNTNQGSLSLSSLSSSDTCCGLKKRRMVSLIRMLAVVSYLLALMALLMSNIIQSAQVTDGMIRELFGCSYGLEMHGLSNIWTMKKEHNNSHLSNLKIEWVCGDAEDNVTPFCNECVVISAGFVALGLLCGLFANKNLDDSIILQWIANVGLVLFVCIWIVMFAQQRTFDYRRAPLGFPSHSAELDGYDHSNHDGDYRPGPPLARQLTSAVGVSLFNFAFVVTVPSWVNEKRSSVSVRKSLVTSLTLTVSLFVMIGVMAAMAFPRFATRIRSDGISDANANLFTALEQSDSSLVRLTVYIFPMIQNVTAIPVYSIIIRYNLELDFHCSRMKALILSVLVPWILSALLYSGDGFDRLCDFAGVFVFSLVNFVIPPALFICAVRRTELRHAWQMQPQQYQSLLMRLMPLTLGMAWLGQKHPLLTHLFGDHSAAVAQVANAHISASMTDTTRDIGHHLSSSSPSKDQTGRAVSLGSESTMLSSQSVTKKDHDSDEVAILDSRLVSSDVLSTDGLDHSDLDDDSESVDSTENTEFVSLVSGTPVRRLAKRNGSHRNNGGMNSKNDSTDPTGSSLSNDGGSHSLRIGKQTQQARWLIDDLRLAWGSLIVSLLLSGVAIVFNLLEVF